MTQRTLRLAGLTLFAGLLALTWAYAAEGDKKGEPGEKDKVQKNGDKDKGDKDVKVEPGKALSPAEFVRFASESDVAEIALGKLANKRGANPAVKKFGERMATDHAKSAKKLKAIAKKNKLKVATQMNKKHRELAAKLAKLKGAAFDRTYISAMVRGHKRVAEVFRTQSESGTNADLKAFAAETLPVIERHLKRAEEISDQLGSGGGKKDSPKKGG